MISRGISLWSSSSARIRVRHPLSKLSPTTELPYMLTLFSSPVDLYDKQSAAVTEPPVVPDAEDVAADDRIAEEFRREFFDALAQRHRRKRVVNATRPRLRRSSGAPSSAEAGTTGRSCARNCSRSSAQGSSNSSSGRGGGEQGRLCLGVSGWGWVAREAVYRRTACGGGKRVGGMIALVACLASNTQGSRPRAQGIQIPT
jgi:hypothetical protein